MRFLAREKFGEWETQYWKWEELKSPPDKAVVEKDDDLLCLLKRHSQAPWPVPALRQCHQIRRQ